MDFSTTAANAVLDQIETLIGANGILEIRSGAKPATADATDTGTVLATLPMGADPYGNASGRLKALTGSLIDTAADASGTPGHFRAKTSGGVCVFQGTVTGPSGGGDIVLDSATITAGQAVTIISLNLTA